MMWGMGLLLGDSMMPDDKPWVEPMYELTSDADVDRAVEGVFGKRVPPVPMPVIADAWKAIVTAAGRPPVKVIFDTDIGTDVDDAIALAFALRRPEIDILAVTTSRGEVHERAAIVSRMLQIAERTDIPFAPGSPVMFNGVAMCDKEVNQFPFAGPEEDRPKPTCDDAQDLFARVIEANPGEVWMVVVGPMTNAALLIRDRPDLAAKLRGIACMGGEPTRPFAETNIERDPEAAELVCRSGLLKFVGSYDVTVRILMPKADIERLRRADTPVSRAVVELIRLWRNTVTHKPGPVVFDMVPVAWLFAPELFTTTRMGVKAETAPAERRGVMSPAPDAPPCAVTTDVNVVAVHRLLMDTLA
jgi:pyrimidine-specific ribonucleoside hydrolase